MQRLLAGGLWAILAVNCAGAAAQSNPAQESQKPVEGSQPAAMGGVNTGGAHAAVLDAEHRPITAGGFVKTGPVIFEDISEKSGLAKWHHQMGDTAEAVHYRDGGFGCGAAGL